MCCMHGGVQSHTDACFTVKLLRDNKIADRSREYSRAKLECPWCLQLIDKWRASKVPEDAKVGKSMGREDNERVIGQLLYDSYLQFDFSYTAYATNAYLKASQRASLILQGEQALIVLHPSYFQSGQPSWVSKDKHFLWERLRSLILTHRS